MSIYIRLELPKHVPFLGKLLEKCVVAGGDFLKFIIIPKSKFYFTTTHA